MTNKKGRIIEKRMKLNQSCTNNKPKYTIFLFEVSLSPAIPSVEIIILI